MSDRPNHEDIVSALLQSGYLMEQEIATQLEALNYHVSTSWPFEDTDEGKSREIDVRAIRRFAFNEEKKLAAFVEIIAECKNSANPFVFIGRPKNGTDNKRKPFEYVFPVAEYHSSRNLEGRSQHQKKDGFFHLGFDQVHYDFKLETKAVQFCRMDRKGSSWHANHGGLYDAIFYPMAKALTARKRELPKNFQSNDWKYFWFLIPLVVVSGDIFYLDSTKSPPSLEERDHVSFKRELRAEKLNGTFVIDFVRQNRLETFVSECLGPIIERATDLTMNHADLVLKQHVPWED